MLVVSTSFFAIWAMQCLILVAATMLRQPYLRELVRRKEFKLSMLISMVIWITTAMLHGLFRQP